MSVDTSAGAPLHAWSVPLDDPGSLLSVLPPQGMSWVRRDEGLVAWGEVARHDSAGDSRIDDAHSWFRRLTRHAEIRDEVHQRGSGLIALGAFAFADNSASGGTMVVPRYVVGRREHNWWLTEISMEPIPQPPTLATAQGVVTESVDHGIVTVESGDQARWFDAVEGAVARIKRGEVEKVVLARAVDATAADAIDVRVVLQRLARDYPTCWSFHVDGMVGATPELLARVDHGLVTSRVLAGTIRPTGDEVADLAHAAALARSSKDREEHEFAVRSVTRVLAEHCASVNVPDEPSVLHLPNVMHLATDVTGVLDHHATSLELVRDLHPSAAVCGTPTLAAAHAIDDLEHLDRGRYAGPVGWMDSTGDGEWCIALRAAHIDSEDPRHIRLYAGCGIVAASEPEAEWAESEAKLEPMKVALGITESAAP